MSASVTGGESATVTGEARKRYQRDGRRRCGRGRAPELPEGATAGVTGEGES